MNSFAKKIFFLLFIITVILLLRFSRLTEYLNFATLKAHREYLFDFVQAHYVSSVLGYIITYILVTACSLPVAVPLTLIGGFLFGVVGATIYINIGATIGATILFLLFRYFLGKTVQEKYHTQLATFNENIDTYGVNYLILARLVVFIPFFLVNILAGLTRIPVKTFILTTSFGIIPGTAVYAFAGREIGSINAIRDILSGRVVVAFMLLIGISLGSILVKKIILKRRQHE